MMLPPTAKAFASAQARVGETTPERYDGARYYTIIQQPLGRLPAPIVLATKKYLYRLLAITGKDVYLLPRIDDSLDALAGSQPFSTLNLVNGYWQIEVDPADR